MKVTKLVLVRPFTVAVTFPPRYPAFAARTGAVIVHSVELAQLTFVALSEPIWNVVPPGAVLKFVLATVTGIPPVTGPWPGVTPATAGKIT